MRHGRPQVGKGRPFAVGVIGNSGKPGRPKGAKDLATKIRGEISEAIVQKAFDRLVVLVEHRSGRIALEASRTVLAYAWGLPRATLEVQGGMAEFGRELATALQEARARRQEKTPAEGAPALPAPQGASALATAGVVDAELVDARAEDKENP